MLCDRLLLYAYLEELHAIDAKTIQTVIQEVEQDNPLPKTPSPETRPEEPQLQASGPSPAGNTEARLRDLENEMQKLRRTVQKERALLRKAILIQLDMDDCYDDVDA